MFECIFENLPQEVYILNPESLKFVAVNRAARENIGYTTEELNIITPSVINSEFDAERFHALIRSLSKGEQKQIVFNTYLHRKDGTVYSAEINLQLFNYAGEELCMAQAVDLMVKYRIIEGIMREKIDTFDAIMDAARDAIVVVDNYGRTVFWNISAESLFGYSQEEILGKELHRFVVPEGDLYEASIKAFKEFLSTGTGNAIGKIMELKAKHKDGHEFDAELSLSALRIKGTWYAVGIVRDISERKKVQEELERSRQRYLELAENAPIGILSCDSDGNIIYVNQMVLELLGSSSVEETRKINLLTFPLLIEYGFSRKLKESIQNREPVMFEAYYKSKWGKKVWLRIHIKPLISKNVVTGAQIIIDDIGEIKQLERQLFHLSITDPLTNVYNRRYFVKRLEEEIERARRTGSKFSIIMMDIDYFKNINDRYGHNSGDLVLKKIMSEMLRKKRKIDILARWGGEEFIILLPETTQNEAVFLAERLRQCLNRIDIPNVGNVTASFGVAEYSLGDTVNKIVHNADVMMYKAKSAGRNCVR